MSQNVLHSVQCNSNFLSTGVLNWHMYFARVAQNNLCSLVLVWGCDPSGRRVFVTGYGCRRSANGSLTQLHGANYSGNNGPLLKLHFELQYLCISCVSACKRTEAKVQKNWCRVYKSVRLFEKLGGNIHYNF